MLSAAYRFTDGDFHNLKLLRLDRPQRVIKQKTYSGPSIDQAGHDHPPASGATLRRAFTEVPTKGAALGGDQGPPVRKDSPHKYGGEPGGLRKHAPDHEPDKYADVRDSLHKYHTSPGHDPLAHGHAYGDVAGASRAALKVNGFMEATSPSRVAAKGATPVAFKDTPPPPLPLSLKPYRTEVSVEVHRELGGLKPGESGPPHVEQGPCKASLHRAGPAHGGGGGGCGGGYAAPGGTAKARSRPDERSQARHAHSLETVSPADRLAIKRDQRRVKSYDGELPITSAQRDTGNYDRLEITEFSHGPFYNAEYDGVCEGRSPELRSKVRSLCGILPGELSK